MSLVVILDNIRSVLNVGAILRTCDGAGVEKLCLCGITPLPDHEKIGKTALGAETYVNWQHYTNTLEAIAELQAQGYKVFAVEQTATATPYQQFKYPAQTALVFGHEITGVHPDVLAAVDGSIELPMRGRKNSLNVATTVGIMVYHVQFTATKL